MAAKTDEGQTTVKKHHHHGHHPANQYPFCCWKHLLWFVIIELFLIDTPRRLLKSTLSFYTLSPLLRAIEKEEGNLPFFPAYQKE